MHLCAARRGRIGFELFAVVCKKLVAEIRIGQGALQVPAENGSALALYLLFSYTRQRTSVLARSIRTKKERGRLHSAICCKIISRVNVAS